MAYSCEPSGDGSYSLWKEGSFYCMDLETHSEASDAVAAPTSQLSKRNEDGPSDDL